MNDFMVHVIMTLEARGMTSVKKISSMRFHFLLLFISVDCLLAKAASGQNHPGTNQVFMKNLPDITLRGKYRILLMEFSPDLLEKMTMLADEYTLKTKQNTYFIRNGN